MPQTGTVQDYMRDLEKRVEGDLRTDLYSRVLYSTDSSIYQGGEGAGYRYGGACF